MTNEKLKATVLTILRRPGIWKIGFQLGALCVTGQRYAMVARAIADGSIECQSVDKFESQGPDALADGMVTEARYDIKNNAMLFPRADYGNSPMEERAIFHETTHAMFDLFANSHDDRTLAIDDESAAVLAEALYLRLCDRPVGGFAMMIEGRGEEALKLADKMMAETGDFEKDKRTYFLRPEQTQRLREEVAKDWHYTKFIGSDGLATDATRVQYIYDGVVKCYSCWVHGQ